MAPSPPARSRAPRRWTSAQVLLGLLVLARPSNAATDGLRINEVATACANGDSSIQFVELIAPQSGQTFESSVGLRVRDHAGTIVFDRASLFTGRSNGAAWATGRTWLIATVPFEAATSGLFPDLEAPLPLDPTGGTLTLYDTSGGFRVLHEFNYGTAGGVAAPAPGHSLQLQASGSMAEKTPPDPRTFAGRTVSAFSCPAPGLQEVRIREIGLACLSELGSDPSIEFVELAATGSDGAFRGSAGIQIQNATGEILYEATNLFPSHPDGTPWPAGRPWLIATQDFESGAHLPADLVIPAVLDPEGGTIAFFDTTGGERTIIHSVSYGIAGAPPAPHPGRSLELQPDGSFAENPVPTPANFSGASLQGFGCSCSDPNCIRVNEFAPACQNFAGGDSSAQFIELIQARSGQSFRSSIGLRVVGSDGTVRLDRVGLFSPQSDGAAWPVGHTWLLSTDAAQNATGVAADLVVPAVLPRAGGTISLYDTSGGRTRVFLRVPYGGTDHPAPPAPGHSLQLQPNGLFLESQTPSPADYAGRAASSFGCACPSPVCVRISELAVACFDYLRGDSTVQFIELAAMRPDQTFRSTVGLRVKDRFGNIRFDQAGLFSPQSDGAPWPEGNTWLLATSAFQSVTGVRPDLVMPFTLDPAGGTLTLYDLALQANPVIEEIAYGTAGGPPAPAPGHSLQSSLTNGIRDKAVPDPTNFAGQASAGLNCPCPSPACVRVNELGLACSNCEQGDPAVQFIELTPIHPAQSLGAALGLRVTDHLGSVIFDLPGPLSSRPEGTPWAEGTTLLLATQAFRTATGLEPDRILPGTLDAYGGKIALYESGPSGPTTISELNYGGIMLPGPWTGSSLQLQADGSYALKATPDPTNFSGVSHVGYACPCPSLASIRMSEAGFACANGSTEVQFVELESRAPGQKFRPAGLRVRDRNGVVTLDEKNLFPSQPAGSPWPQGRSWLIARPVVALVGGVAPDLSTANLTLDPVGGTITLYDATIPSIPILQEFSYGSAGGVAAPAPGHSLQLQADGSMAEKSTPDPTNFSGQTIASLDCSKLACPCAGQDDVGIDEFMLTCEGGDSTVQFLTLRAFGPGQQFRNSLGLEVRDRSGTRVLDVQHFVGPDGATWPAGKPILVGTTFFASTTGISPDVTINPVLDTQGGTIALYDAAYGIRRLIQTLSYGTAGGPPAPAPGHSLARQADGSYAERAAPNPSNYAGQTPLAMSCDCPYSNATIFGQTRIPARDSSVYYPYFRIGSSVRYDLRAGSFTLGAVSNFFDFDGGSDMTANDRFRVIGLAAGTPVALTARLKATASGSSAGPHGFYGGGVSAEASLVQAASVATVERYAGTGTIYFDTTLAVPIQAIAGADFSLSYALSVQVNSGGVGGTGQLSFTGLPPGASVTSCQGYPGDVPVAAQLALASASASVGLARLDWFAADATGLTGRVERRTTDSAWAPAGTVVGDGTGHLVFQDRSVVAGTRYAYRLSVTRDGATETTAETWLEIPAVARFALHGVRPNPAHGSFEVSFELPDAAPATLDVLDITGRRVESRGVGLLGAGPQAVTFGSRGPLPAGIYVVRLTRAGHSLATKACVIW